MTATLNRTSPAVAAPQRERRPELRVVGPKPRRRPVGALVGVTVIIVFGTLFLNAIFHSVMVSGQARLDGLNQQVSQAEAANQQLRLKVATLEAPDRIVDAATAAGMVLPDETHWIMADSTGGGAVASTSERLTPTTVISDELEELAAGPDAGDAVENVGG